MSTTFRTSIGEKPAGGDPCLVKTAALLEKALRLLDAQKAPPEIGALVQSALDAIADARTD